MTSQKQIRANRRNAKKSTGPKTEGSKARSKHNALKHGLRSIEILIPDEDPAAYEELRQGLTKSLAPVGCLETELVERIAGCLWRVRRCGRIEACLLCGGEKIMERILTKPQDQRREQGIERLQERLLAKIKENSKKGNKESQEQDVEKLYEDLSPSEVIELMMRERNLYYSWKSRQSEKEDRLSENPWRRDYWDGRPDKRSECEDQDKQIDEELLEAYVRARKEELQENPETYNLGLAFSDGVTGADELSKLARYEATQDRALYRAMHELQRLQEARKGDNVLAPAAVDVNVNLGK
jgi:hypothetical protein